MQNALDVVRVQPSNLVHHAVHDELSTLSRSLFLKHIDEHDVHHSLHQNVCTIRTNIVDALNPIGVVVVFLYAKLQAECVAQRNCCSAWLVLQLMRKTFEVIHYLTVHLIAIIVRKKVQLTNREGILCGVVVNRHEQLHQPVRRFVCP